MCSILVYEDNNTVEYSEDEVEHDAARWRWRVVDGVIAISQSYVDRVLENALVVLKVSQRHVPAYSTDQDTNFTNILFTEAYVLYVQHSVLREKTFNITIQ